MWGTRMASTGLSGMPIARIFGITVRIHASWLIIFFLLTYSLAEQILPLSNLAGGGLWLDGLSRIARLEGELHRPVSFHEAAQLLDITLWPTWEYWLLGALGSIGLFVCVLAHELSHSVVAQRAGIPVEGITLFVFGGVSQLGGEADSPGVEFRVAAAGPLMSVLLAAVCGMAYYGLGTLIPGQARALLIYFAIINLMLAVFNLLPGFPLDGGRLLRAILWKRYGNLAKATSKAAWMGRLIGGGFVALGLVEFWWDLTYSHTFSAGPLWLVLIGLFLRHAARMSAQQLVVREVLRGQTVRDAIQTSVITITPDLTLDRAVDDYFFRYKFRSFPVLEGDRLIGMISLRDLQNVPRTEWPAQQVRDAMHQIRQENLVRPSDDLDSVLRKMAEEDKGHLPVVEAGRLCGIVTRHDLLTLIQFKTDLGGRGRAGA